MRFLEHAKSLPREEQIARREELVDACRKGDIFRRRNGEIVCLQSRRPDGTWEGDLLEDMEGNPDPDGDECCSVIITADDLVDFELLPHRQLRLDVKGVREAAESAISIVDRLCLRLSPDESVRARKIIRNLKNLSNDLRSNRLSRAVSNGFDIPDELFEFAHSVCDQRISQEIIKTYIALSDSISGRTRSRQD